MIAGRQHGCARAVAYPGSRGDQGGEGLFPVDARVEQFGGQLRERPRARRQQGPQVGDPALMGERGGRVAIAGYATGLGQAEHLGVRVGGPRDEKVRRRVQRTPERALRHNARGRPDQVLPGGVIGHPLEAGVEQPPCKLGYRAGIVADGRAGGDAAQRPPPGDPVTEPAQQHGQLGGLGTVVDVRLVHSDETPVAAVGAFEQVEGRPGAAAGIRAWRSW